MSVEKEVQLEIAHVLFIDIVGYSKLSVNDQHAAVEELNQIVRAAEQFQRAEAARRLLKIPTGDGMVLVFYASPEAPAQCAVEISRALKEHPRLHFSTMKAFFSITLAFAVSISTVWAGPRGHGCGHTMSMPSRGGATFSRGTSGTFRNWSGRNLEFSPKEEREALAKIPAGGTCDVELYADSLEAADPKRLTYVIFNSKGKEVDRRKGKSILAPRSSVSYWWKGGDQIDLPAIKDSLRLRIYDELRGQTIGEYVFRPKKEPDRACCDKFLPPSGERGVRSKILQ